MLGTLLNRRADCYQSLSGGIHSWIIHQSMALSNPCDAISQRSDWTSCVTTRKDTCVISRFYTASWQKKYERISYNTKSVIQTGKQIIQRTYPYRNIICAETGRKIYMHILQFCCDQNLMVEGGHKTERRRLGSSYRIISEYNSH